MKDQPILYRHKQPRKIYLMSPFAQEKETNFYCFEKCGKVIFGVIDFMGAPFIYCFEDECPYAEKSENFGVVDIDGEKGDITVRKLKEVSDGQ